MSTRSPAISLDTACTREPRMPTHAPTGSMRGPHCCATAILARTHRITRRTQDLDGALADFRHFQLEQFDQELRRRARQEQLRSTRLRTHILEEGLDAVLGLECLAQDQVAARDETLGIAAEVNEYTIAIHALDHATHQRVDAVLETAR